MSDFEQFIIHYTGLEIGNYQYDFLIEDWFFDKFAYSEIKKCKININLMLDRQENMLVLTFLINGSVNVICDRCLDYFDYPVNGKEQLIVKFGKENCELTEEILVISYSEHQFDISQYIYEYINLLLPIKRIHTVDEKGISKCDKKVLKIIDSLSKVKNIDSRWDILKELKNNNKTNKNGTSKKKDF